MKLYDSMSREKREFLPRGDDGVVKIFTCGPSVYARAHIGNYRTFAYEDVLVRYLGYLGHKTLRAMNFTDVEDKSVEEALAAGADVFSQTAPAKAQFLEDCRLLELKEPDFLVGARESVDEAIRIIQILLEKGVAYLHQKSVFFDPLKIENFGKLYQLDMSRWPKTKKRFKLDTYPGMRWNRGDFILWHGAESSTNAAGALWESPFGAGRPSWNVEDPAVILKTLGPGVDINCGGIDNIIRHHDYNIAVIESASGLRPYANFYTHGAHLFVDGLKMSKSLGNIIYPGDLLAQGYAGADVRFFLIASKHYREKLNFTPEAFRRAVETRAALLEAKNVSFARSANRPTGLAASLKSAFERAMDDDLNLRTACEALLAALKSSQGVAAEERTELLSVWNAINGVLRLESDAV